MVSEASGLAQWSLLQRRVPRPTGSSTMRALDACCDPVRRAMPSNGTVVVPRVHQSGACPGDIGGLRVANDERAGNVDHIDQPSALFGFRRMQCEWRLGLRQSVARSTP